MCDSKWLSVYCRSNFSFLGLIQQVGVHFQSSSIFKEFLLDKEKSITDLQYRFLFNDTAVFVFYVSF